MTQENLSDDMLTGVRAIAEWRGESERRCYYLLEKKQIPGFKILGIWHARKSKQLADIERREQEAMAS